MPRTAQHWLVGGGIALLALLLGSGLALLAISDWNRARPWLGRTVAAALERPFAINGDLRLHWVRDAAGRHYRLPRPQLSAADVVIGNPEWAQERHFGEIGRITAVLDPLPLFGRSVALPLLDIERARIALERRADGRANWTFGSGAAEKDASRRWRVAPGLLRIHHSEVRLDDVARQLAVRAEADSYRDGILWSLRGTLNGAPLRGHGMAGSLLALQDRKTPYPIAFELSAGDTRVAARGTLTNPSQLAALDVRLNLAGTSMAQLYALTGIALPETPPFSTDGHLSGVLDAHGGTWRYENFNGKVGNSDLHGSVVYQARPGRPLVTARLTSENLHFTDLAPLIGADSNASKERRHAPVRQPEDKVLPVEPFKTERWGSVDLTSKGLQLQELFPASTSMQPSLGQVNGAAGLTASGNSVAALAGSASGEIRLFMDRATVSKFLLEAAGLNLANVVVTRLFGDRQVTINCAAADFRVDRGRMHSEGFIVDTQEAVIDIDGAIQLGAESLDLKVKPQTKGLRILSLRSPLYVRGTFKHPDVELDKGMLALRGGGAVALGAVALPAALIPLIATGNARLPDDNGCVALLARARAAQAHAGRPAP